MKTFLKFFPAFVAAAFSLASCNNKEEIVPEVPQPPVPTHTVKFTSEVPETKTDMHIDGNTAIFSWTNNDINNIIVKENGVEGEITDQSGIKDGKLVIYATFPGESGNVSKEYTAVLNGKVGDQTPRDGSYDESADILIAKPIMGVPTDGIMFQFHRPVTINKMTLCNLPAGQTLKTVTIRSTEPIAGTIKDGDWNPESFGNSIVLSVNRTVPANGELEVCYTSVPAQNAILTVDARVGTDSYLKTFGRGLSTTAGNVKIYSVGLVKQAHLTLVENFNAVNATTNQYGCTAQLATSGREAGLNFEWTAEGTTPKVFVFKNGIRLGTSGEPGTVQNSTMLAPVPTGSTVYIKVYAARWNNDKGNVDLDYNGQSYSKEPASPAIESPDKKEYSPTDFPSATEFSFVKASGENTFSIASSSKRIIIDKVEVEFYSEECGLHPSATVNTPGATGIGQSVATLNGSYTLATSPATATFFKWGSTPETLTNSLAATEGANGSFSATLTGLEPETTYYYRAYVTVNGTEIHTLESETFCGEVESFTTANSQSYSVNGWLELPAAFDKNAIQSTTTSSLNGLISHTHYFQGTSGTERNYTFLYDPEMYASYWVAYPLAKGHTGGSRENSFGFDPDIAIAKQTDVRSGYGVNISTQYHTDNHYARGHQIPDADRSAISAAQAQTYYATNMTPQIQNGFNGGIWSSLEGGIRQAIPTGDTLYIVTGAAFRIAGGNETVTTITNTNDNKVLPIANYYWKVVLKVKRNGTQITEALAVGFWLPHTDTDTNHSSYSSFSTSVHDIEQKTGFDFFANLPANLQATAETNANWETFCSF
ncbi:MAG: DNA/RNA non-specific endonuclease [Bacteroidales bacterium]|nr:DNA/RNA non-specific endonuclease [Bacteroidales bacterium]